MLKDVLLFFIIMWIIFYAILLLAGWYSYNKGYDLGIKEKQEDKDGANN